MTTTIDRKAPAIARGSIQIEASPETVWDIVSDIERWPEWNPDVTDAELHGSLAAGGTFTWKAGPGKIRSSLSEVDAPRRIAWTGKTLGISAVHTWVIEPTENGVELTTEESWSGLPVRLFPGSSQRTLDKAVSTGLHAAKQAAETVRR